MLDRRQRLVSIAILSVALLIAGGAAAAYVLVLRGSQVAPLSLDASLGVPSAASSGGGAGSGTVAVDASASNASLAVDPSGSPALDAAQLPGTWRIADGSVAGYRVREQLAFLSAESDAVGRTTALTGQAVLETKDGGLAVSSASFTADLTQLKSDDDRRDGRLRRDSLESDRFPTATFQLAGPLQLAANATSGAIVSVKLTGDLTLHGVTKRVTIPAQARLSGDRIEVAGSYTFPFSDFAITPPSAAIVLNVSDQGTLEFKLLLAKQP